MHPATAEKCEEKWQTLNLQLNCLIQKWEQSGQGDGGFFGEEEEDTLVVNSMKISILVNMHWTNGKISLMENAHTFCILGRC